MVVAHPALHELINRLRAAELHAARAGREVMHVLAQVAAESAASSAADLAGQMEAAVEALLDVMPAYAPPLNVMHRIMALVEEGKSSDASVEELRAAIAREAEHYRHWSEEAREKVALHGAQIIPDGAVLFTFTLSETVMGTLRLAHEKGKQFRVLVTESRPNHDGLTTAALLDEMGIPVSVSIDACIGELVPQAELMLVGAEAIMADGSAVCKVGTYPAALVAKAHGVPVFVVADTMKFNASSALGLPLWLAPITEDDVLSTDLRGQAKAVGHLFDRTPAALIAGVVTEHGVLSPTDCSAAISAMPLSKTLAGKLAEWAYRPHPR